MLVMCKTIACMADPSTEFFHSRKRNRPSGRFGCDSAETGPAWRSGRAARSPGLGVSRVHYPTGRNVAPDGAFSRMARAIDTARDPEGADRGSLGARVPACHHPRRRHTAEHAGRRPGLLVGRIQHVVSVQRACGDRARARKCDNVEARPDARLKTFAKASPKSNSGKPFADAE